MPENYPIQAQYLTKPFVLPPMPENFPTDYPTHWKITPEELMPANEHSVNLPQPLQANLWRLLSPINEFRRIWGRPMLPTSGYRTPTQNAALPNSKPNSAHLTCEAVDFIDSPQRELANFCIQNQNLLRLLSLYLEHPDATQKPAQKSTNFQPVFWVHFQVRPTRSGKIIFWP